MFMMEHNSVLSALPIKRETTLTPTHAESPQSHKVNEDERVIAHINFPLGFIKYYFKKSPEYREIQQLIDEDQLKEAVLLAEERNKR